MSGFLVDFAWAPRLAKIRCDRPMAGLVNQSNSHRLPQVFKTVNTNRVPDDALPLFFFLFLCLTLRPFPPSSLYPTTAFQFRHGASQYLV